MIEKTQKEAQNDSEDSERSSEDSEITQMHVVDCKLATDTTTTKFSPVSRDRVTVRT